MPRPSSDRRSTWPAIVLMGLALLPGVYVLSVGPVRWLLSWLLLPSWVYPAEHDFYLPLDWLAEACPPFGAAFEWYLSLWLAP